MDDADGNNDNGGDTDDGDGTKAFVNNYTNDVIVFSN